MANDLSAFLQLNCHEFRERAARAPEKEKVLGKQGFATMHDALSKEPDRAKRLAMLRHTFKLKFCRDELRRVIDR